MYERPGAGVYVTATKAVQHGKPATENGYAGIAIKQKAQSWAAGLAGQDTIAIGEQFHLRVGHRFQVPNTGISGATKGQLVYIIPATNVLTLTATSNVLLGRVAELPADNRGVPPGTLRIDGAQAAAIA